MTSKPSLPHGLYDRIVDATVAEVLKGSEGQKLKHKIVPLLPADSHEHLAHYLAGILRAALHSCEQSSEHRLGKQVDLCRAIVSLLAEQVQVLDIQNLQIEAPARRLLSVQPHYSDNQAEVPQPGTPLSFGCLLTGTGGDPSLVSQLQLEMASADEINILCSFIRWSGIRILRDHLEKFTERPGTRLRVLTTTYMGASEERAISMLASLPNTQVRVSYNHEVTRLHAKAYQFVRHTGYGSAYIGSANMTAAALTDGLEWNLKVSQVEQGYLWDKVSGTFETYWNDPEFELYDSGQQSRLATALSRAVARNSNTDAFEPLFDLKPHAFQQEILDRLAHEREVLNRQWQMIVAATGTGKTMIAAFDFKRWLASWSRDESRAPRFLFIAHVKEILEQSVRRFRHVLRQQNFGEIWTSESNPTQHDNLFVSIQTWHAGRLDLVFPPDYFDYIVVDEFHHAAAATYHSLLSHVEPRILVALTATPERHDGLDVMHYFQGHATSQIRLPDAINRKLLSPFQYFCVTDTVDLKDVQWRAGGYAVHELESLYLQNSDRNELIIQKIYEIVRAPSETRALGFCASQAHAVAIATFFNERGLKALNVDGNTKSDTRRDALNALRRRDLNFLFTVDLFNEGVDIPEIDTVLFLRPTQSLTVFLQQLGRGLRLHPEKECLTVIDFVGQAHKNYRFEEKFRSLLSETNYPVAREIMGGFPHLPAGCTIQMEKLAREYVLKNIEQSLRGAVAQWVTRASTFEEETGLPLTLQNFLEHYDIDPAEIYRKTTWSRILSRAGKAPDFTSPDEEALRKGFLRSLHISDTMRVGTGRSWVKNTASPANTPRGIEEMLSYCLWGEKGPPTSAEGRARLLQSPVLASEYAELLALNLLRAQTTLHQPAIPEVPAIGIHGQYTRDEVLLALGQSTLEKRKSFREGVLHISSLNLDVFFITLEKNEREFSPSTRYEDSAISANLFQWESQSTTSDTSKTGQRYINHKSLGQRIVLFVRERSYLPHGLAAPFYCLGPAEYVSHTGSRPIKFRWRLQVAMPAHLLRKTQRLAIA